MPTDHSKSGPEAHAQVAAAAAAPSRRTLSKSDFTLARTCAAKLYFREHRYPDNTDDNPYLELLAEGGYMVEALAKAKHADGIQVEYHGDTSIADAYARTIEYLERDDVTLFDATLLHNRRQARVDILVKRGATVRLLEVKAKSFDGDEQAASLAAGNKGALRGKKKPHKIRGEWAEKLEDVAFQTILLEKLRPDLHVRPYLVLVDKSKRSAVDGAPLLFDLVVEEGVDGKADVQTGRYSRRNDLPRAHIPRIAEGAPFLRRVVQMPVLVLAQSVRPLDRFHLRLDPQQLGVSARRLEQQALGEQLREVVERVEADDQTLAQRARRHYPWAGLAVCVEILADSNQHSPRAVPVRFAHDGFEPLVWRPLIGRRLRPSETTS